MHAVGDLVSGCDADVGEPGRRRARRGTCRRSALGRCSPRSCPTPPAARCRADPRRRRRTLRTGHPGRRSRYASASTAGLSVDRLIDPSVHAAMAEIGIDLAQAFPKKLTTDAGRRPPTSSSPWVAATPGLPRQALPRLVLVGRCGSSIGKISLTATGEVLTRAPMSSRIGQTASIPLPAGSVSSVIELVASPR